MLLAGGVASSGARVLSLESVRLMTTDQLPAVGHNGGLGDAKFNSHAKDGSGSGGMTAPQLAESSGHGLGLGFQVVTRPSAARIAGARGSFSAWGYAGTECWSDPALELTVFVGTHLFPGWALPEVRQEV